jgi:predicted flap endonuclease-1-like 5' DNA nuclease
VGHDPNRCGHSDTSNEYEDRRPPEKKRTSTQQTERKAVEAPQEATKRKQAGHGGQKMLTATPGVGSAKVRALREAGYETPDDIRRAKRSDLASVTGIGESLAGELKHTFGAQTVQDRAPSDPPGEMIMPVQSEEVETNHTTVNGIKIDVNNVEFVELRHNLDTYYYGLTANEFSRIQQQLEEKHGETPVENIITGIHDWKDSSGVLSAQTHEEAFKNALGIDAPIRDTGGDPRRIRADDPEVAVARDLAAISQEVLRDHLDDEADLIRGLRFALPDTATQILDNPNQDEYALNPSVLSNFTGDTRTAVAYSDVAVRISAMPDDLALAPDSLLRHRRLGDGELVSDCEFQIRAEALRTIDSRDIIIGQNGHSLAGEFENIPESDALSEHPDQIRRNADTDPILPEESHQAIVETVRLMADVSRDTQRDYAGVETNRAKRTLTNWLALYTIEGAISERERLELRTDIHEIVQDI